MKAKAKPVQAYQLDSSQLVASVTYMNFDQTTAEVHNPSPDEQEHHPRQKSERTVRIIDRNKQFIRSLEYKNAYQARAQPIVNRNVNVILAKSDMSSRLEEIRKIKAIKRGQTENEFQEQVGKARVIELLRAPVKLTKPKVKTAEIEVRQVENLMGSQKLNVFEVQSEVAAGGGLAPKILQPAMVADERKASKREVVRQEAPEVQLQKGDAPKSKEKSEYVKQEPVADPIQQKEGIGQEDAPEAVVDPVQQEQQIVQEHEISPARESKSLKKPDRLEPHLEPAVEQENVAEKPISANVVTENQEKQEKQDSQPILNEAKQEQDTVPELKETEQKLESVPNVIVAKTKIDEDSDLGKHKVTARSRENPPPNLEEPKAADLSPLIDAEPDPSKPKELQQSEIATRDVTVPEPVTAELFSVIPEEIAPQKIEKPVVAPQPEVKIIKPPFDPEDLAKKPDDDDSFFGPALKVDLTKDKKVGKQEEKHKKEPKIGVIFDNKPKINEPELKGFEPIPSQSASDNAKKVQAPVPEQQEQLTGLEDEDSFFASTKKKDDKKHKHKDKPKVEEPKPIKKKSGPAAPVAGAVVVKKPDFLFEEPKVEEEDSFFASTKKVEEKPKKTKREEEKPKESENAKLRTHKTENTPGQAQGQAEGEAAPGKAADDDSFFAKMEHQRPKKKDKIALTASSVKPPEIDAIVKSSSEDSFFAASKVSEKQKKEQKIDKPKAEPQVEPKVEKVEKKKSEPVQPVQVPATLDDEDSFFTSTKPKDEGSKKHNAKEKEHKEKKIPVVQAPVVSSVIAPIEVVSAPIEDDEDSFFGPSKKAEKPKKQKEAPVVLTTIKPPFLEEEPRKESKGLFGSNSDLQQKPQSKTASVMKLIIEDEPKFKKVQTGIAANIPTIMLEHKEMQIQSELQSAKQQKAMENTPEPVNEPELIEQEKYQQVQPVEQPVQQMDDEEYQARVQEIMANRSEMLKTKPRTFGLLLKQFYVKIQDYNIGKQQDIERYFSRTADYKRIQKMLALNSQPEMDNWERLNLFNLMRLGKFDFRDSYVIDSVREIKKNLVNEHALHLFKMGEGKYFIQDGGKMNYGNIRMLLGCFVDNLDDVMSLLVQRTLEVEDFANLCCFVQWLCRPFKEMVEEY